MSIPVDDPADPRLADFAAVDPARRRREVERAARAAGFLVAEGTFAVRRLIASGRPLRAVLVDDVQERALADVLGDVDAPVYLGTRSLIEATLGYAFHRGAIASADRDDGVPVDELLAGARTLAVLEAISDLENLGSIFRNAAAFGVDGVLLDPRCADPFARRSVRVSMGHVLSVPWARAAAWPEVLDDRARGRLHGRGADAGRGRDPDRRARGRAHGAPARQPRAPASASRRWRRRTCACGSRWRPPSTR